MYRLAHSITCMQHHMWSCTNLGSCAHCMAAHGLLTTAVPAISEGGLGKGEACKRWSQGPAFAIYSPTPAAGAVQKEKQSVLFSWIEKMVFPLAQKAVPTQSLQCSTRNGWSPHFPSCRHMGIKLQSSPLFCTESIQGRSQYHKNFGKYPLEL